MPCIGRIGSVLVLSSATALAGCGDGAKEVPETPAAKKTGTAGAPGTTPPPAGTKAAGKKSVPRSTGRD
jgi:hypothetical protein